MSSVAHHVWSVKLGMRDHEFGFEVLKFQLENTASIMRKGKIRSHPHLALFSLHAGCRSSGRRLMCWIWHKLMNTEAGDYVAQDALLEQRNCDKVLFA